MSDAGAVERPGDPRLANPAEVRGSGRRGRAVTTEASPSAASRSRRILIGSPVYRGSRPFLGRFLGAWRRVSYPDVQFCIVENGTPDPGTRRLLPRRGYVRQPGDLCVQQVEGAEDGTWRPVTRALNAIRQTCLEGEFEFLLLNETSRPCPRDIAEKLVGYNKAVIGALYKSSYHPGQYCVYDFDPAGGGHARAKYLLIDRIDAPCQVGGIGFGALLIHRTVLERVAFRSAEYAADTYFAADLKALHIPVYAAPIVVPNLKIDGNRTKLREWTRARQRMVEEARAKESGSAVPARAVRTSWFQTVDGPDADRWAGDVRLAVREINDVVPPGDAFVLVDQDQWRVGGAFGDRRPLPFMGRNGEYWGPPGDDDAAIRHLSGLRRRGVGVVVFGWPAFWWLDHYARLRAHIEARFECRLRNDRVVIFEAKASR